MYYKELSSYFSFKAGVNETHIMQYVVDKLTSNCCLKASIIYLNEYLTFYIVSKSNSMPTCYFVYIYVRKRHH